MKILRESYNWALTPLHGGNLKYTFSSLIRFILLYYKVAPNTVNIEKYSYFLCAPFLNSQLRFTS